MSRWTECLYCYPPKLCCNWFGDLQR